MTPETRDKLLRVGSKRIVAALGSDMGEGLSQLFVRATFSEHAKDRARAETT